ncbi:MAG TPA: flagellar motor protein MotB [Acidimicrobiales bacterium]|jgi:chemotaxis protein MotB|nr:flagellar motor protein MotB [Acidimicrobiales bacterium]
MRRTPEPGHEGPAGMERWLLTYSDMITLLLVLFIVLYALSSLNHVKYAQFERGVATSFNDGPAQPSSARTRPSPTTGREEVLAGEASLRRLEAELRAALRRAGLLQDTTISIGPLGLTVGLVTEKTFYSIDSASLSTLGDRIVDVAAHVLRRYRNPISVDGYTDNEPILGGPFQTNWQLSAQRAVNVVQRLQADRVRPSQLYAVGFGQYHPSVPNNSARHRAENRRVDIVVSRPGQKVTIS